VRLEYNAVKRLAIQIMSNSFFVKFSSSKLTTAEQLLDMDISATSITGRGKIKSQTKKHQPTKQRAYIIIWMSGSNKHMWPK